MKKLILHVCTAALALAGTATAYAKPVGSMSCSNMTAFNVSAYDLGLTEPLNIGSSSSGAGAGKVTFQALEVHASIAQFQQFFNSAVQGKALGTCKLTVTGTDGSTIAFTFKTIAISSLTVAASGGLSKDEEKAAFTDIKFEYAQIEIVTNPGTDDGGQSPIISGWNTATNKSS